MSHVELERGIEVRILRKFVGRKFVNVFIIFLFSFILIINFFSIQGNILFFYMVKMDGIYHCYLSWFLSMRFAYNIFICFLRENNKIKILESPSSLLKRIKARYLDHPEFIYLIVFFLRT